jgi:hypothetical protein
VARGVPVMTGTAGELGVDADVAGTKVESGLFVAAPEVIDGENAEDAEAEAPLPGGVFDSGTTAADCVAASAACLCLSPLTATATPTMILMRIRKMRRIIAMPLLVLYQWYAYEGSGDGVSAAVGCVDSSLSSRFVGESIKGFGPWFGA